MAKNNDNNAGAKYFRLWPNLASIKGTTTLLAWVALVAGCGQEPDPVVAITQAVHEFSAAINKSDFTAARTLACGTMFSDLSRPDDVLKVSGGVTKLMGVQPEIAAVAAPHIDGDQAHVPVTIKYTGDMPGAVELTRDYEIEMHREGSAWKICSYAPAAHA